LGSFGGGAEAAPPGLFGEEGLEQLGALLLRQPALWQAQLGPDAYLEHSRRVKAAGIVRNKGKIGGTVKNAKALCAVQKEFGSFDQFIWSFVGGAPIVNAPKPGDRMPATTAESDAMSKALKKRGFTFVGSTICYAFMQATGMVNDHLVGCPARRTDR